MRCVARKNELEEIQLTVIREQKKRRKKKKKYPPVPGRSRIAKEVKKGQRKPPKVPKNKTVEEIHQTDRHSMELRNPTGRKRKYHDARDNKTPLIPDDQLTWREHIRRVQQQKKNERRAAVRKWEAEVVAANREIERTKGAHEKMSDEDLGVVQGLLSLDEWDDEELVRGYRRKRNGKFGPAPEMIPREIQQEALRRLVGRGERKLQNAYIRTVEKLVDLAHNASSEKVQLEAVKALMERVVGKVPDKVLVSQDNEWQDMLVDSMIPVSEAPVMDLDQGQDGVFRLGEVDAPSADSVSRLPGPALAPEKAAPSPKSPKKKARKRGTKNG